ncbi:MAG: hypothetical protein HY695_16715 [Deltaproteobacteria bacterium]|nr:hypothetical protein [Deltaproteobacteria bacterium]
MKNDSDPFVRACLRENPTVFASFFDRWKEYFDEATQLERLALVRNPKVAEDISLFHHAVIEKIFDPEDKALAVDLKERRELVIAFLTNNEALARVAEDAGLGKLSGMQRLLRNPMAGEAEYTANTFLSRLWELASKWSKDSGIPYLVYRYLPANDETKAQAYKTCNEAAWKYAILENCGPDDRETLKLGTQDSDDNHVYDCRYLAYSKVTSLEPERLDAILQGNDMSALDGLAHNRSLSVTHSVFERVREISGGRLRELGGSYWTKPDVLREKVLDRLNELDKSEVYSGGAHYFHKTVDEEIRKTVPPEDPRELFGDEGREGNFLEDKIDFIGRKLFSLSDLREQTGKARAPEESEEVLGEESEGGNSLEEKIDFIGKRLVSFETQISETIKTLRRGIIILLAIWVAWTILVWLFR